MLIEIYLLMSLGFIIYICISIGCTFAAKPKNDEVIGASYVVGFFWPLVLIFRLAYHLFKILLKD